MDFCHEDSYAFKVFETCYFLQRAIEYIYIYIREGREWLCFWGGWSSAHQKRFPCINTRWSRSKILIVLDKDFRNATFLVLAFSVGLNFPKTTRWAFVGNLGLLTNVWHLRQLGILISAGWVPLTLTMRMKIFYKICLLIKQFFKNNTQTSCI